MTGGARLTLARFRAALDDLLWSLDTTALPRRKALAVGAMRVVFAVGRDLAEGQLTLRAMSLVYTTLLSLVPLLAISFSVLKGFGVHNQIEPLLLNLLAPLGEKGVEIAGRIIVFVENVKVGVLGTVGLALLFYTVVSLMQKIERAFNYIWHVTRERTLIQRFRDYLSVIVVGPALVFSSMGLTASVMSARVVGGASEIGPLGALFDLGAWLVPYLMVVAAFTFIYVFIPNTRVRVRSALIGGVVAGVLWNVTGWLFASFVVSSAQYAAIYSTFATLILFLIWIYLGWLILLVGASIGFYHQRPEYAAAPRREIRLSNRTRERLALLTAHLIAGNYYAGRPPWTAEGLAQRLGTPLEALDHVLATLEERGIFVRTGDDPPAYLPARPLETTEVAEVLDAVRSAEDRDRLVRLPADPVVDAVIDEVEQAMRGALGGATLRDLALADPDEPAPAVALAQNPASPTANRG